MKGSNITPSPHPIIIPPSFPPTNVNIQNPGPLNPFPFHPFPPNLNGPIPPHPPLYIPPSFPPPGFNQQSMLPPFNLNINQSPFQPINPPISAPYSSNFNMPIPPHPPSYIPPAFHPSQLHRHNLAPRIPNIRIGPLINRNDQSNPRINELLEDVEMTEEILNKSNSKSCVICMEDYEIGEKICYLPCFHYFHSECIRAWTKKSKNCPVCKATIKI